MTTGQFNIKAVIIVLVIIFMVNEKDGAMPELLNVADKEKWQRQKTNKDIKDNATGRKTAR